MKFAAKESPAGATKKQDAEKASPAKHSPPNLPKDLAELLEKIPGKDAQDGIAIIKALVEKGPAVVVQLVEAVGEKFGDPAGVKPTYALHGMVHYAPRQEGCSPRSLTQPKKSRSARPPRRSWRKPETEQAGHAWAYR